ncbi:MAG: DMT family transporter [Litorivicinaceae bacterium]
MSRYLFGTLIMVCGVLILSPDSATLRKIGGDPWVVSFWRGIGICSVIWLLALLSDARGWWQQLRHPGWTGAAIVVTFGLSQISFVLAVTYLGAPTVLVLVSTTPLASAVASWLLFRERTDGPLWCAIMAGVVGASIAGSGVTQEVPWIGWLGAFGVPTLMGVGLSLTRAFAGERIWPLYGLSSGLGALAIGLVIPVFAVPAGSEWWMVFNACIVVPLSFALITIAPRYLPAPEVGLYLLLETLIGPIFVWFLVGESPTTRDFLGGAILLTALSSLFIYRMLQERARKVGVSP